jgi:hypothetical protein
MEDAASLRLTSWLPSMFYRRPGIGGVAGMCVWCSNNRCYPRTTLSAPSGYSIHVRWPGIQGFEGLNVNRVNIL